MTKLDEQNEIREGCAEIDDVKLHYVEAGEGPLVVVLHGSPAAPVRPEDADRAACACRLLSRSP